MKYVLIINLKPINKEDMKFKDDLQKEIHYRSQIDYCYWMLQEISQHHGQMQNPLAAMIDEATGFNKAKVKEKINDCIYLIKTVIRCKPKCLAGYDVTEDKKFLKELNKLNSLTDK